MNTETSINTNDTMINIPRKSYEKILFENEAQKRAYEEIKDNVVSKFSKLKESKEKEIEKLNHYIFELKNKEYNYNKDMENNEIKDKEQIGSEKNSDNQASIHSVFKLKPKSDGASDKSSRISIFSKSSNKKKEVQNNNNNTIKGGNIDNPFLTETQKHTTFNDEKEIIKDKTIVQSESSENDEDSDDSNTSSEYSNSSSDGNYNSDTYRTEEDIYTIKTEDEVNKAYKSLKNEMGYMDKKMNRYLSGGKMEKHDLSRMNFILKSLRTLDKFKKNKK